MLIEFSKVVGILANLGISVRGILHVGAHDCEELVDYEAAGIHGEKIVWIEAMQHKVQENIKRGVANMIEAVVDEKDGETVIFKETNNGQSSSILDMKTHSVHYPFIQIIKQTERTTQKIDTLLQKFFAADKRKVCEHSLNFWNLDIQGVELRALRGASRHLKWVDAIYTEVNEQELYENCDRLAQIDTFLNSLGFTRIETKLVDQGWGDALYVRVPIVEVPHSYVNNCDPETNGEMSFLHMIAADGMAKDCVIDIGARDDIHFANIFATACTKHLFEPHPDFFASLSQKIAKLEPAVASNVHLHNVGLAAEENYSLAYHESSQSFFDRRRSICAENRIIPLKVVRLDSVDAIAAQKWIDLIKIDTEGYELEVLQGAPQTLEKCSIVQFEYGGTYPDRGITLLQVVKELQKAGFLYFYILHQRGYSRLNVSQLSEHLQYSNYIATKAPLPYSAADANTVSESQQKSIFGQILCINLDHRLDRWDNFKKSFSDASVSKNLIERFSAIELPLQGWIGCVRSHIAALKLAIERNYERVTICEDDFVWKSGADSLSCLSNALEKMKNINRHWDVYMLGARLIDYEIVEPAGRATIVRATRAATASGYIVQRHYMLNLLRNFEEAERLLVEHAPTIREYENAAQSFALDQNWYKLQKCNSWYTLQPTLGKQMDGLSNISNCFVAHTYEDC